MRFWLFLLVIAAVGFGLGSGLAYGLHTFRPNQPGQPLAAATSAATPTPASQKPTPTSGTPSAPTPSAQQGTPAPGSPTPAGRGGGGQFAGGAGRGATGTISRLEGGSLVVSTPQGERRITLGPETIIQKQETATRDDIKVGVSITATMRGQGDGPTAGSIIVGGSSPMALGGSMAMGARGGAPVFGTISKVSGDSLTVDTPQGQQTVAIGPDTTYQRVAAGKREDLVPGLNIMATGTPSADQSSLAAATILILPASSR